MSLREESFQMARFMVIKLQLFILYLQKELRFFYIFFQPIYQLFKKLIFNILKQANQTGACQKTENDPEQEKKT